MTCTCPCTCGASKPLEATTDTVRRAVSAVASEFEVIDRHIMARSRIHALCDARFATYALLYEDGMSMASIGVHFGGRDHSGISHGIKRVVTLCSVDANYRERFAKARNHFERERKINI